MSDPSLPTITVNVKSAWLSKVNWTQGVAGVAMLLAFFTRDQITINPDQQAAIIVSIGVIGNVVTWVIKTWFTSTVNQSSLTTKGS